MEVDDPSDEGDDSHGGHLLILGLVDDLQAECKCGDEDVVKICRHGFVALGSRGGVLVHHAI